MYHYVARTTENVLLHSKVEHMYHHVLVQQKVFVTHQRGTYVSLCCSYNSFVTHQGGSMYHVVQQKVFNTPRWESSIILPIWVRHQVQPWRGLFRHPWRVCLHLFSFHIFVYICHRCQVATMIQNTSPVSSCNTILSHMTTVLTLICQVWRGS